MIDHLLKFPDAATAQADPVLWAYWHPDHAFGTDDHILDGGGSWDLSRVEPTVKVWQPVNDTTSSVTGPDGALITVTTHSDLPYFYLLISLSVMNDGLRNHPGCMIVADREKALRGEDFLIYTPIPVMDLPTYALAPLFAGTDYPFG